MAISDMSRRKLIYEHVPSAGAQELQSVLTYRRFMFVVLIIAVRPQSILLVVIGIPRHALVGMDSLDMRPSLLVRGTGRIGVLGKRHGDEICGEK